jgi:hypothetical protein
MSSQSPASALDAGLSVFDLINAAKNQVAQKPGFEEKAGFLRQCRTSARLARCSVLSVAEIGKFPDTVPESAQSTSRRDYC